MSLAATMALVAVATVAAYAWGRRGLLPAADPADAGALADIERRLATLERAAAPTGAPVPIGAPAGTPAAAAVPTGVWAGADAPRASAPGPAVDVHGDIRAAARRRDKHLARRHYEALADEVARERRLAEFEARATGTDSAGARVVHLPVRPAGAPRVLRYRADQRA
jgi:hypothetical protein